MSERLYNFSAGPATLNQEVLEASAAALLDYKGKGVGIAEVSHRGPEFKEVIAEAEERCRALMRLPDEYAVLFLQGGATQQFDLIPMNFLKTKAQYIVSGQWAKKAATAGKHHGDAAVIADSSSVNFAALPTDFTAPIDPQADFLHICSNNTIFGTRFSDFPEHPCLIADMSSEIMGREIDIARFGMVYAGAQKNLGPSGVVLAIVRKDLLANNADGLSPIFDYAVHAEKGSCLNTPPTFGIYVLLETFRWLERQGGIAAMEQRNEEKAALLYAAIDGSDGFYSGTVTDIPNRSRMNVTFTLPSEDLTTAFLKQAAEQGLVALKGYRTVGGVRASIYNAMPTAGVEKLVAVMQDFAARNR
ncbi:MAG: 3-phosphoserine/phosphohydroxythreonine transaminase [Planctomycetota bacterium]